MPKTAEQNATLRAESRAKIMAHALELFARYGYEQTSVRMIAQAAGISQGLLYNYFASKDQLLQALMQQSMQDVRASFAQAETASDPQQQLEQLIRASFAILQRNMAFWQLSYSVRMQAAVRNEMATELREWSDSIQQTLERYLRAAGIPSPELESALLFAQIDGVAQHYALNLEGYPLDALIEHMVARYR